MDGEPKQVKTKVSLVLTTAVIIKRECSKERLGAPMSCYSEMLMMCKQTSILSFCVCGEM